VPGYHSCKKDLELGTQSVFGGWPGKNYKIFHGKAKRGNISKIAVIGTGYAGLVTEACLAHIGHIVMQNGSDEMKMDGLYMGEISIYWPKNVVKLFK
jgi:hypothetical protein